MARSWGRIGFCAAFLIAAFPQRFDREALAGAVSPLAPRPPPDPGAMSATLEQATMVHVFDTTPLGTRSDAYYVNDHSFIQGPDGAWHLFGIFHREPIGEDTEYDFVHAVAEERDPARWDTGAFVAVPAPYTMALHADKELGESHIWAPHIVRAEGRYWMMYQGGGPDGDHASIRLAESDNLYRWTRVGRAPIFEDFCVARDPMLWRRDNAWALYYTRCESMSHRVSGVAYRLSNDLVHWSEAHMALTLEDTPPLPNSGSTESPFLFEQGGYYYLSVSSYPRAWDATMLYRSPAPFAFPSVPYARLRSHAGEWLRSTGGRMLLSHAGPGQRGVWIGTVSGFDSTPENEYVWGVTDQRIVLETGPLGFPWVTADPFLFCVHHDDAYPAGNAAMGPAASLAGRNLGQDFGRKDGWSMYHGEIVPGFPQHPHRGFETVTILRSGVIDHSDSLGATARFGPGDVQWLTAGGGIVHCEMFPLLREDAPNPLELFQIWLNLPKADKLVPPHFGMLWSKDIPRVFLDDERSPGTGRGTEVTIIAGSLADRRPPAPPPHSWASRPDTDVAIWTLRMDPGVVCTLPPVRPGKAPQATRTLYFFRGSSLVVGGETLRDHAAAVVRSDLPLRLEAGTERVDVLVLQGRPIAEPVVQYGPFVMNTRAEIQQAIADYQATKYGGWPWPNDAPVHPRDEPSFAKHADGRVESGTA